MSKKREKWYDIRGIKAINAKWNWLFGERSNGKSYAVKEMILTEALREGKLFAYVRREREDIKVASIEGYWDDMDIDKISGGEGNCIIAYRNGIYIGKSEDGESVRGRKVGDYFCLSGQRHYRSIAYPDTYNIVFEEAITSDGYLYDEVNVMNNLVSTILRKRDGKVWMIGNTVSQECPYFAEWHLGHIYEQKKGTIETYTRDGCLIACEYCESAEEKSTMFFGRIKNHIEHGDWDTDEYPIIRGYNGYERKYSFYFRFNRMIWYQCELLYKPRQKLILFVHPYKRNFDFEHKRYRIIDGEVDMFNEKDPFITRNFKSVTRYDELCKEVIEDDLIVFSDDLTGKNFYIHKKKGGFI